MKVDSDKWELFDDSQSMAFSAAQMIKTQSELSIQHSGLFKIVLAGGTTPLECYSLLAGMKLDWDKWYVFFGDERCLGKDDPNRNYQLIRQTGLLDKIKHVFEMPAECNDRTFSDNYAETIKTYLPFDVVVVGMGDDGHTASLFPNHPWENKNNDLVIFEENSPKPPSQRVSLNVAALQSTHLILALVTGRDKKSAVAKWRDGVALPIAHVMQHKNAVVMIEENLLS